jgi:hypothetical protein
VSIHTPCGVGCCQVERLEFLLEKLRSDYAYFTTLERM